MFDVSGCAGLFGGERALGRDMLARLSRQGFHVRIGLADTPGAAWAVARHGDTLLVPPGATGDVLRPLPLAALRLAPEVVSALAQAGLKTIGDVIMRPRAPLAARFGQMLLRRLDQALGEEEESIEPRLPAPSYLVEQRFAEPIGHEEDVLGTIALLAGKLERILERHGEGARLLEVVLYRADGRVVRLRAGSGAPLRDPSRVRALFIERIAVSADECDPGFGYDMVRLSALAVERMDAMQTGLAGEEDKEALAHLIDRLSARFGAQQVTRFVPADTHIPEDAMQAVAAQHAGDFCEQPQHEQDSFVQEGLAPIRPIRLFEYPELIETVAEVPDGPPAKFRWRRVMHEVAVSEGPERIEMEWWRAGDRSPLPRDYFRVETRDGLRAWLYRQGIYGRSKDAPRWFLHGLFA
jgi:protein ImuB